ncbi:unnamed protein product [Mesocestoides corti]|uniref:TFIIS N-terminal domain-containing protein n=2 Tax=Mesocestoides corti TaxID=53468 RepID=A0A0R3UIT2_MESCO|nr:unnamed protein product [Mesocestoides corti]
MCFGCPLKPLRSTTIGTTWCCRHARVQRQPPARSIEPRGGARTPQMHADATRLRERLTARGVVDIALITRAVEGLEVYPMSMLQLQETKVAQLLQTIRHQVDSPLQKRIRAIIKAWQKLLEPDSACATVIPLQRPCNPSNPISQTAAAKHSASNNRSSPRSNGQHKPPRNHSVTNPLSSYQQAPSKPSPASSCPRKKVFATSLNGSPRSINGRPLTTSTTEPPKLAKVKSTAELIQAAGGCIDSVTKDRILSNRIAKESDEYPRLVPQAIRSSRKAKNEPKQLPSAKSVPLADRGVPAPSPQRNPPISAAKSEMIAKFLEHSVVDVAAPAATPRSHSAATPASVAPLPSCDPQKKHHHHSHRHAKEKRKHKRKYPDESDEKPSTIPITNRMDDWPELPPLTDDVLASAFEERHSGDTPSFADLVNLRNVGALLDGSWPEVSATRDDDNNLQPMTALYSVDMGDDQLVHILPWTNLSDYRQTFFPSGAVTDLDRLIDLPDPW